ncbi:MAG: hypothetical protein ACLSAH_07730 [Bilophila wadsworthia]
MVKEPAEKYLRKISSLFLRKIDMGDSIKSKVLKRRDGVWEGREKLLKVSPSLPIFPPYPHPTLR